MKHTLVFSDLHLSIETPGTGVWMRFRQRRFFIDEDFSRLVDRLLEQTGDERLEVVFNGDTFELDGASANPRRSRERPEDMGNEASEALALDRILRDHEVFVDALGRLLARAERVVFVSGNHDLGLYWPTSQQILRRRLAWAAKRAGSLEPLEALRERVSFRQWFHRTGEGVYVEHGQQYDAASATPDPLIPTRGDGRGLWQSFGSAGYRYILGGLGTMNPHQTGSFLLGGLWGYLRHFFRYYFGRRRSLVATWLRGSIRCASHLLAQRETSAEPGTVARWKALTALSGPSGLSSHELRRLRSLQVRPMTDRPFAIWRELWLERVLIFGLAALVAGVTALLAPLWLTLTVLTLVVGGLITYERLAPDNDLEAYEPGLPGIASRVSRITGDRYVVLGHTHRAARRRLPGGAMLINTGSWSPSFADPECTRPVGSERTFAWFRSDAGQVSSASLLAWQHGELVPFGVSTDETPAVADPAEAVPYPNVA